MVPLFPLTVLKLVVLSASTGNAMQDMADKFIPNSLFTKHYYLGLSPHHIQIAVLA